MLVYVFQAALLCEECGVKTKAALDKMGRGPLEPDNEYTWDSDDYPKGPYPDGGGEADCYQYCDKCGQFLDNPLTADGELYESI